MMSNWDGKLYRFPDDEWATLFDVLACLPRTFTTQTHCERLGGWVLRTGDARSMVYLKLALFDEGVTASRDDYPFLRKGELFVPETARTACQALFQHAPPKRLMWSELVVIWALDQRVHQLFHRHWRAACHRQ